MFSLAVQVLLVVVYTKLEIIYHYETQRLATVCQATLRQINHPEGTVGKKEAVKEE